MNHGLSLFAETAGSPQVRDVLLDRLIALFV